MYKILGADQKEYGPITADQIRQWISERRVNSQTRIRVEGSQEWTTVGNLPEFGPAYSSATPRGLPREFTEPPPTIRIFGVLNIVLGSLALLCSSNSFIRLPLTVRRYGGTPVMHEWLLFSALASLIGGGLMLTSGVGLCNFRSWARKVAVYYAIFAFARALLSLYIFVNNLGIGSSNPSVQIRTILSLVMGVGIGLGYNGLLVFFLSKREVKEALGETSRQM